MKPFAVLALAVILAPAALAQHQTFVVNPDASAVRMTLKTTRELVNGTFHVQSGSIEFDCGTPNMSGSVAVLAGSGKTDNDSRDNKMYKDVLRVKQHPTVSFAPKTYTGTPRSFGRIDYPGKRNLHPSGNSSRNHRPPGGLS